MSGKTRSTVREYVEAALWALVLTLFLRGFVIQAFRIPSESMKDTLLVGDFLFVNKFEYGPKIPFTHVRLPGLRDPRRGDVIVFQFPQDPSKDFIKRCIATGGQTLEVKDKQVVVDGEKLVEPYAIHINPDVRPAGYDFRDNFGPLTVPARQMFMMGDNRDNSNDSRYWGTLKMDLVKGRAMFIYWSWNSEKVWPRWNRLFSIIH
ncbi:MAG: signal peptidase I [Candidatus Eisenbacteria bacterium RBG_16_71_46]|nr:MAG: signal peptidase I [Candidatus Eisenbacteria bacterium RBG_16_71_46]OGF23643.1 MAG: signal peptidase I [Candidatus Eisenbacteria bacterium RBG_19FT_COMBO_70_11]